MRRASGPQTGSSSFFIRKQGSNKNKSPYIVKAKSKSKIVHQSQNSNVIIPRKTNSFSKIQQNQSSTFFTTQNNKSKKSRPTTKKPNSLKKYQKQIMQILHSSACIIQRQWRKYLIRKYKKQLSQQNSKAPKQKKPPLPQFDSVSGRTSHHSQLYNNRKYYSCQQSQIKKSNQNSFTKDLFSFNLPQNNKNLRESPQKLSVIKKIQTENIGSDLKHHHRTRSDQTAINPQKLVSKIVVKAEEKCLQIAPKILNVIIQGSKNDSNQNLLIKNTQQSKYEDHFILNQKGSLDQILNKIQSKLQQKKLKKILSLQNSFSNNLMTFRSYKKNVQSVSEQHNKILTILQHKKNKLLAKLNEFAYLCQKNVEQLKQQDLQLESNQQDQKSVRALDNGSHHLQMSFNDQISGFNSRLMMTDDWDLQAQFSDKKLLSNKNINQLTKKDEEILIDDGQRQTTLINQLISQDKNQNQDDIYKKIQTNEVNETIFNTPPKLIQLNQSPILKQIKKSQDNYTSVEQKQQNKYNSQNSISTLQLLSIPSVKQQKILQHSSQNNIKNNKNAQQIKQKNSEATKKLRSQKQVQQQLKRFHPIQPTIDFVNNWLLEISHFILDNFGGQFLRKLVNVEQPDPIELFRCCKTKNIFNTQYISISQKIFKQFQFYHIKMIQSQQQVQNDKKQAYSALTYTFHQALYDCLNKMLLDELIEGRNWINYPWSCQFKVKKLISAQYSKQSLQKAINRVSNISDYNILPLDPSIQAGRQFQQTQHNLIFAEQIKQISLNSEMERGYLIYNISQIIQQQIVKQQVAAIFRLFI